MSAYYNENDPKAAAWLRELIKGGHIAPGDVDERSITDISPHDLTGYTQQHFFAGIGGWSYALRLAGWPDDRAVRTGSCPCQPFSAAGKQLGEADERHLWPVFRDLITFGEPAITFGEQVASALGREWLAGVRADLEGMGYEVGAADLCAAGASPEVAGWIWIPDELEPEGGTWIPASAGPPHIRQRLFWMAHANRDVQRGSESGRRGAASGCSLERGSERVGNADRARPQGRHKRGHSTDERSPWSASVVLPCTDGKARRIEPGTFPLAHGVSGRVGLLRGYGNAIVPQLAAEFIEACCDVI